MLIEKKCNLVVHACICIIFYILFLYNILNPDVNDDNRTSDVIVAEIGVGLLTVKVSATKAESENKT